MVSSFPSDDADLLYGGSQNDTIDGLGGEDRMFGLAGDDSLSGGAENDWIDLGTGADAAWGDAGNDTILGGALGIDTIFGGAGDDRILSTDFSSSGTFEAYGGKGNDIFILTNIGDATVRGGEGRDVLGLYWLDGPSGPFGAVDVQITGPGAHATSESGVVIDFAGIERLALFSGAGDDRVTGGDWQDVISVGRGQNLVQAGAGADMVDYALGEANTLDGGAGFDRLTAYAGDSAVYFVVNGPDGAVDDGQLSQITGFERFAVYGGAAADTIGLWTGNDSAAGAEGDDTIWGRDGRDTLYGDDGNDVLAGDGGGDSLRGGLGDDSLAGGAGNDTLGGSRGADTLDGGAGNDRLILWQGADTVTGGTGADVFLFQPGAGLHLLTDFTTAEDRIEITAAMLPAGPAPGDPVILSESSAQGSTGQFIRLYDAGSDETLLLWDPDGSDPAGSALTLARLQGDVALAAADLWLV